jgi:hypothetical protein
MSAACVRALHAGQLLGRVELAASTLGEDHLFALSVKAAGFDLGDFVTGDNPMCLRWKGLPDAPARLRARGKKIIHSVRFWEDLDEESIRAYFRTLRQQESAASAAPPTDEAA